MKTYEIKIPAPLHFLTLHDLVLLKINYESFGAPLILNNTKSIGTYYLICLDLKKKVMGQMNEQADDRPSLIHLLRARNIIQWDL